MLLPAPGRPGDADRVGVAGGGSGEPSDLTRLVATALDERQQPGERGPVAGCGGSEELGDRLAARRASRDVDDLGHAVDAVAHDPLDPRLQRLGGRRAADAGADQLDA